MEFLDANSQLSTDIYLEPFIFIVQRLHDLLSHTQIYFKLVNISYRKDTRRVVCQRLNLHVTKLAYPRAVVFVRYTEIPRNMVNKGNSFLWYKGNNISLARQTLSLSTETTANDTVPRGWSPRFDRSLDHNWVPSLFTVTMVSSIHLCKPHIASSLTSLSIKRDATIY